MSDNTTLNPGTGGDTIASDEVAGVKIPRSKIIIGADGVSNGDVAESNPLPVKGQTITWAAPGFSTVGVTSSVVLAANANRKGATFINDSVNEIYLGIGAAAGVGSGKRLNANGGSYEINLMNLSTQVVNAIATGASSNLCVDEAT